MTLHLLKERGQMHDNVALEVLQCDWQSSSANFDEGVRDQVHMCLICTSKPFIKLLKLIVYSNPLDD